MNSIDYKLYCALKGADGFVSGDQISEKLGVSRMSVSLHAGELKARGIEIESKTRLGYRLVSDRAINEFSLARELEGSGITLLYREVSPSTFAETAEGDKVLVVAREQQSGRGRRSRSFSSRAGGIYMSYVFTPKIEVERLTLLVLLAGLAVSNVLQAFGVETRLKWPNDVIFEGKKLVGILSESSLSGGEVSRVNIGIGINVENELPRELNGIAVNLKGRGINQNVLCVAVAKEIDRLYGEAERDGFSSLLCAYRERSNTLGKRILVCRDECYEAVARDISDCGFLLCERDGKIETVTYGDVSIREAKQYENRL